MKKILPIVVLLLFPWHLARGQVPYLEEVKALGVISGQGMACGSSRHPTFEMLARAIMLTKAPTPQMLNEAAYIYSEEKPIPTSPNKWTVIISAMPSSAVLTIRISSKSTSMPTAP